MTGLGGPLPWTTAHLPGPCCSLQPVASSAECLQQLCDQHAHAPVQEGEEFEAAADKYLRHFLHRGIPSLFSDLKSFYGYAVN